MPSCSVKYCPSRTSYNKTKNVTFYRIPKEDVIRQQWLDVLQRKDINIKVDAAMMCSNHFDDDCFIMEWTKPRSKNVPAKEMKRLKKNSIPTKMLNLEKNKIMPEKDKSKILIRTGTNVYRSC